jgi:hypothetical protein
LSAAAQAGSWAIACRLAGVLGPRYRLIEGHPGGGQYDVLWLLPVGGDGAQVLMNRAGSIHVKSVRSEGVVEDVGVWGRLGSGEASVSAIAERIVDEVGAVEEPMPGAGGIALLAEVARTAALFDVDWQIVAGWCDSSGQSGSFYRRELYEAFGAAAPSDEAEGPDDVWFVVSERLGPLLCVDLAAGTARGLDEMAAGIADAGTADLTRHFLKPPLVTALRAGAAGRPGLGLPGVLSQFNRKERFFLLAEATGRYSGELHGASLDLTSEFRQALGEAVGLETTIPDHAWASFDYHLDWLHGALQWAAGRAWPGQDREFAERLTDGVPLVRGSQEDIDLVVCWVDPGPITRLVLVEAKGYGAWSTKQAESKIPRVRAIVESARAAGVDVDARFVLSSPRPPKNLSTAGWPEWAVNADGSPRWLLLPAPGERLVTERCDDIGMPSSEGTRWRIVGP